MPVPADPSLLRQKTRDDSIICMRSSPRGRASESLNVAPDLQRLATVAEHLNYNDLDGLYAAMGYGDVEPETVLRHLKRPALPLTLADDGTVQYRHVSGRRSGSHGNLLRRQGFSHRMSQCCNPLPGDDIVGYITRGGGWPFTAVTVRTSSTGQSASRVVSFPCCGRHAGLTLPDGRGGAGGGPSGSVLAYHGGGGRFGVEHPPG